MKSTSRQVLLWIGLSLAIILGALWQFAPLDDARDRFDKLPIYGPGFVGQDIALSPWEQDFFKQVNVLKRVYEVAGQRVFISALDGTKNRHAVHDPLYCFRGSGWAVVKQETVPTPDGGTIGLVTLSKDGKQQDAMFWFSDGNKHYDRPLRYWWDATIRRLTLGKSGEEPVLVMVQPIEQSQLNWKEILRTFPQLLAL